jgi:hypothetical protein
MPWGGVVIPDGGGEQPPVAGWGDANRFERVTREERRERKQREVRSVLFRVKGLRATGEVGEPSVLGGYGRAVQLRGFRACHGAVGVVQIAVDVAPFTPTAPQPGLCICGEVQVHNETQPELQLPARIRGRIGKLTGITAQRNLTDDELIHMIAEML